MLSPRAGAAQSFRSRPGRAKTKNERATSKYLVLTAMIFAVAMMSVDQTIVAIARRRSSAACR